jgi:hypothetical protein
MQSGINKWNSPSRNKSSKSEILENTCPELKLIKTILKQIGKIFESNPGSNPTIDKKKKKKKQKMHSYRYLIAHISTFSADYNFLVFSC